MKKAIFVALAATCIAASAVAADLAPLEQTPTSQKIVIVPFEWAGFYVGAHVGFAWGDQTWHGDPAGFEGTGPLRGEFEMDGFFGGGHIGYNYEIVPYKGGSIVIGAQGDVSWIGIGGHNFCNNLLLGDLTRCASETKWLAAATVRIGIASELLLFYVKAGGAVTSIDYSFERGADFFGPFPQFTAEEIRLGWTVGGGIEYRLTQHWSGFIEYDFYGFGTNSIDGSSSSETFDVRDRMHVFKGGINYRFGGPVVARY